MSKQMAKWMLAGMIIIAGAMLSPTWAAEEGKDNWRFMSPTYLWAAAVDGDITSGGVSRDIDLSYSDLTDKLDASYQFYFELRKDKFGFFAQPNYMKFSNDQTALEIVDIELTLWIVEFGGFYQVMDTGGERPLTVDAIVGGRYWGFKTDVEVFGQSKTESTVDVMDPIIGVRARKYFNEKCFGSLRADIGGFDLGTHQSTFSWQVVPMVGYDFNKYFTGFVGWRQLALDYEASNKGADLQFGGVLIGFNWDFFAWLRRNK